MSLREKTRTKKPLKVVNFSVASKDDKEIKYTIIILHTRKRVIFKRILSKGVLLKIRTSIDDNSKEHSNIGILSSKLLKVKE